VACAATAAHEMVRAEGIELSIEFMHWSAKQRDGLPASSEGTTLSAAKSALAQDGQPPEQLWLYDDTRSQWTPQYRPPTGATAEARNRRLRGGGEIRPSGASLRNALDGGQPIVLGLRIYSTWHFVGPDGAISAPPPGAHDLGGHAVLVMGYRNDIFIVQNSWGTDWGDDGRGYLEETYVDLHGVAAWALSN